MSFSQVVYCLRGNSESEAEAPRTLDGASLCGPPHLASQLHWKQTQLFIIIDFRTCDGFVKGSKGFDPLAFWCRDELQIRSDTRLCVPKNPFSFHAGCEADKVTRRNEKRSL